MKWRLIPLETRTAAENMAIDEMLLYYGTQPTIRFYRWARPSISLAKNQRAEIIGNQRLDAVRRPTGGHAVYHNDLTYSITAPISCFSQKTLKIPEVLSIALGWISAGLNCIDGLHTRLDADYDIVVADGRKIAGNAMTTHKRDGTTYVLIHGCVFETSTPHDWSLAVHIPVDSHDPLKGFLLPQEAAQVYATTMARVADVCPIEADTVYRHLLSTMQRVVPKSTLGTYTPNELELIRNLVDKYKNLHWVEARTLGTACAADRPQRLEDRRKF